MRYCHKETDRPLDEKSKGLLINLVFDLALRFGAQEKVMNFEQTEFRAKKSLIENKTNLITLCWVSMVNILLWFFSALHNSTISIFDIVHV